MPNKHRGVLTIDLGDGKERPFRFTFEAVAEIEDHFEGKAVQQIFKSTEAVEKLGAKDWLAIFFAGLKGGDPETEITEGDLGRLMDFSRLEYYAGVMSRAFGLSTSGTEKPKANKQTATSGKARPVSTGPN